MSPFVCYPVAMAAGLATLTKISRDGFFDTLTARTTRLVDGLSAIARESGIAFTTNQVGGMFGLFFTDQTQVRSFAQVMQCDAEKFKLFFHAMLDRGVYLAPSAFEAGFVSIMHDDAVIDATLDAARDAFSVC